MNSINEIQNHNEAYKETHQFLRNCKRIWIFHHVWITSTNSNTCFI